LLWDVKINPDYFCKLLIAEGNSVVYISYNCVLFSYSQAVVGLGLGGPEARLKRGAPLMTSSFSANRDKHFDQA